VDLLHLLICVYLSCTEVKSNFKKSCIHKYFAHQQHRIMAGTSQPQPSHIQSVLAFPKQSCTGVKKDCGMGCDVVSLIPAHSPHLLVSSSHRLFPGEGLQVNYIIAEAQLKIYVVQKNNVRDSPYKILEWSKSIS